MFQPLLQISLMFLATTIQQQEAPKTAALPAGVRQLGEVRFPNVGRVMGLAFSPDATQVVAGSWDASVIVWDVATGKQIRAIAGHQGPVRNFVYTPDGKWLITQGRERVIRVWDAATGKALHDLEMPAPAGRSILSPNGKFLWANSGKNMLVWEVATGKELCRYAEEMLPGGKTVGFTLDSKEIVSAGVWNGKGSVVFRDARTGKKLRELDTSPELDLRFGLSYALVGSKLLLSGWDGLHLLDLGTGRSRKVVGGAMGPDSLAPIFSPNSKMFAATDGRGVIHVWETATRQQRCTFHGLETGTVPLAFSPDGKFLASGSTDCSVLLWDLTGTQQGGVATGKLLPSDLRAAWSDLATSDAAKAYLAMQRLLTQPSSAVAFLKEQIHAAESVDTATVNRLIQDLASDKFPVRERATADLGKLGDVAAPAMHAALDVKPVLEVRKRLEKLLRLLEESEDNLPAERLRWVRSVEVVEAIPSAEAVQLLKSWAGGAPGALLTRQAQEALRKPGRE